MDRLPARFRPVPDHSSQHHHSLSSTMNRSTLLKVATALGAAAERLGDTEMEEWIKSYCPG